MWKNIKQAKIELVNQSHMDWFFLDEQIMESIPSPIRDMEVAKWPAGVINRLYKSGSLPDSFPSKLSAKTK